MSEELLTYQQLAERIDKAFGIRPPLSTLRKEHSRTATPRKLATARVTAGLPKPLATHRGLPSLFRAADIDAWIAEHPLQKVKAVRRSLLRSTERSRPTAVARAREAGMSWADVAQVLSEADGVSVSRQMVHKRYGPG